MIRQHIDCDWFRRGLVEGNLNHWLTAAVTDSGFFRVALDRQWRPLPQQQATLVSQSRLLFNFAAGYQVTGHAQFRQALEKGCRFLLDHMHDERDGGWFWSVDPDGHVLEDYKSSYGHAFVILGLSHAYRVLRQSELELAARQTWQVVQTHLKDRHGGLVAQKDRDFTGDTGERTQNPIMHMFEALLALHESTGDKDVLRDAGGLARFILTRLWEPQAGYLPELYDRQWNPRPAQEGGCIDVGHQFEWAYLLSAGVDRGLSQDHLQTGHRLLDAGMRLGYDDQAGGIFPRATYDGRPSGTRKGWWQQAELLRALMRYAARHGREELWEPFQQSLAFVKQYLIDFEFGGWYEFYDAQEPQKTPTHKGHIWKAGYHETGMHMEALRLCGQ